MGLESATFIHQLNPSNPVGAVDPKSQGDDHLRMIKSTLQATFPNITGVVNPTQALLNAINVAAAAPVNKVKATGAAAARTAGAMRNDAQILIDLTDTYAWTGIHSFSNSVTFNGAATFNRAGNAEKIKLQSADADGDVFIAYYRSNGSTRKGYVGYGDSNTDNFYVNNEENAALFLGTNGLTRFTISSTGALSASGTAAWSGIHTFSAGSTVLKSNDSFLSFNNAAGTGVMDVRAVDGSQAYIAVLQSIPLTFYTNANIRVVIGAGGGLTINSGGAAPTGGNKGDGTINATALYTNGDDVRIIPQNSQSANYTCVASDSGKHIFHPNGGGAGDTFTIPANSSVAYSIGTAITFVNRDSNSVAIAITTDTMTMAGTTSTGTRTLAQNGVATAIKVSATDWLISGTGLS